MPSRLGMRRGDLAELRPRALDMFKPRGDIARGLSRLPDMSIRPGVAGGLRMCVRMTWLSHQATAAALPLCLYCALGAPRGDMFGRVLYISAGED